MEARFMPIKFNWKRLKYIYAELEQSEAFKKDSKLVFVIIFNDETAKKTVIAFSDFLHLFWQLSEIKNKKILSVIVQDEEGKIIYKHKKLNAAKEEIPLGGNSGIISSWNSLTEKQKEVYIRLLESQIGSNE